MALESREGSRASRRVDKSGKSQAGFESIAPDVIGLVVLGMSQLEQGD